jgi:hypothetical protein
MKRNRQPLTFDDILTHWRQGKSSLDWRGLTDYEKGQWLVACLHWSGIPRSKIGSFNYIIPGNQVGSYRDFYCLLGEVFFGYRGYFGSTLDGFDDCFAEIAMYERTNILVEPETTVTITYHQDVANIVNEQDPECWGYILDVFNKHGFKVILT